MSKSGVEMKIEAEALEAKAVIGCKFKTVRHCY